MKGKIMTRQQFDMTDDDNKENPIGDEKINVDDETITEEEVQEVQSDNEESNETEQGEAEKAEEIEPWLATDDSELGMMPVKSHVRVKQKLKGRLNEKNDELEKLKAENEQLKAGNVQSTVTPTVRPILDDFDSHEEYNRAMDAYEDYRYRALENSRAVHKQQEEFHNSIQKNVDKHYESAANLIETHGIDPDSYKNSDMVVRQTIDRIFPGQGDLYTDVLISRLGEGSEKVMYSLGRNKAFLNEFQSLLLEDKSGVSAAMFLGERKALLTRAANNKSKASSPGTNLKGDGNKSIKMNQDFKSAYDKAEKSGDAQEAYNARKNARKAGLDVSDW
jgi:hypothetical protein